MTPTNQNPHRALRAPAAHPRLTSRLAPAALALALAAGAADAALPPVLDKVPTGADVVVVIPSFSGLLADANVFVQAFGQALPPDALPQILAGLGILQGVVAGGGINGTGSAAIIINDLAAVQANDADPTALLESGALSVILPINDLAAFAKQPMIAGLQPEHNGQTLTLATLDGDFVMRDIGGGFAVMGGSEQAANGFRAGNGNLAAYTAMVGPGGDAMASGNDVMVIANIPEIAPMLSQALVELGQQLQFVAALGGPEAGESIKLIEMVASNFVRDGLSGMIAMDIGPSGLAIDLGAQFKGDSELANLFAKGGNSADLIGKLPPMTYLAAYSLDTTSPGVRAIAKALIDAQPGANAANPFANFINPDSADGFAAALGTTQVLGGAGLLSNMVGYVKTSQPAAVKKSLRDGMAAANNASIQGLAFSTTYEQGVSLAAQGMTVDSYSVTVRADPDSAPPGFDANQLAFVLPQILGPTNALSGYIAEANGGMYQTFSKNAELAKRAASAGRNGESLASFESMPRATARMLDEGRFAEAYLSINGLASMVGPLMALFGGGQLPEIPAMEPIAFSASMGDGGVTFRNHIPAEVIRLGIELGQQFGDGAAQPEAPGGRPRF